MSREQGIVNINAGYAGEEKEIFRFHMYVEEDKEKKKKKSW